MNKESLITSTYEHFLLHSKSAFLVEIVTLVAALAYSTYSSNVFVQGKPISGGHIDCDIDNEFLETITCCWFEDYGDHYAYVCQTCTEDGSNCGPLVPTDTRDRQDAPSQHTIPPTIGDNVLQQESEPPKHTIPPTIGDNVLQQEDRVLKTQPADEGIVEEPSSSEINRSSTVE
jgi:hypothetical protein